MIKSLLYILLLCLPLTLLGQHTVSGYVYSSEDGERLPGVAIIEKGTENRATTNIDGFYNLTVSSPNAVLVFQFIGFQHKEHELKGEKSLNVKLKLDCTYCWFDNQDITLKLQSGLRHTPFGGGLRLSFPAFSQATLFAEAAYQTDFNANNLLQAGLAYNHFFSTCDVILDAAWDSRKLRFENNLKSWTNAVEGTLHLKYWGIIAGVSNLQLTKTQLSSSYWSPVVGFSRAFYFRPVHIEIVAKAALFDDMPEIRSGVLFKTKPVDFGVNYYQFDTFSEISLSLSKAFGYRTKRQKEAMPTK